MKLSQKGLDLIKHFEGLRLKAYRDPTGRPTIGYGHTRGVKMGQVITEAQAEQFLKEDVAATVSALENALEAGTPEDLAARVCVSQNKFDALVSWAFNVRNWQTSTLLRHVNARQFDLAAAEFPRWVHARVNGQMVKLRGLIRRRKAEADLFAA